MEFRRRQSMEAWRAGSDDLALPELAPLAAELERSPALRAECDALHAEQHAFRSALQEVPLPAGLADRLKHRLLSPAPQSIFADVDVVGPAAPLAGEALAAEALGAVEPLEQKREPRPFNAVRFLLSLATIAAALLIAGLSSYWLDSSPIPGEVLVAAALDLPAQEDLREGNWRSDIESAPSESPFPGRAFHPEIAPLAWRDAAGILPGTSGAVYRIGGARRSQAYLLVLQVPAGVAGLDISPSLDALHSTGGWVAGAWRDGDRVCLLLVEGSSDRFRSMLRLDSSAV